MSNHLPNPLVSKARLLRQNSTEVEKKLWYRLRDRQVAGQKFRRQYPIEGFILDFACEEKRFGIELDGGQHNAPAQQPADAVRTEILVAKGWKLLRFWNHEVMENIDGVLQVIEQSLTRNHEG